MRTAIKTFFLFQQTVVCVNFPRFFWEGVRLV